VQGCAGCAMDGQWQTYGEAGTRLGISPAAVRRRAERGHWARQLGNDGRARIQVPDGVCEGRARDVQVDAGGELRALQAHIETLKAELAAERTRADKVTAELAGEREQLAAARQAADHATAELVALAQRLAAIAEERANGKILPNETPRQSRLGRAWTWFLRN
jgi:hypothetical protein